MTIKPEDTFTVWMALITERERLQKLSLARVPDKPKLIFKLNQLIAEAYEGYRSYKDMLGDIRMHGN